MVTIYKTDGSKSMVIEDAGIAQVIEKLWYMYEEDFSTMPDNYSVNINGKKVYLKSTTLKEPETVENSELSLDI